MDWRVVVAVVGSIVFSFVFAFVVVPEILERQGYNPKSGLARAAVWLSFLAIVLVPAAITGALFGVSSPADWLIFLAALAVAILYDYYRLNPSHIPWLRSGR